MEQRALEQTTNASFQTETGANVQIKLSVTQNRHMRLAKRESENVPTRAHG